MLSKKRSLRGMVAVFGRLFDERFRSAAAGIYAYAPVRLSLGVFVAGFVGLGVGWRPALIWFSAALLSEAIMLLAMSTPSVVRKETELNWWGRIMATINRSSRPMQNRNAKRMAWAAIRLIWMRTLSS